MAARASHLVRRFFGSLRPGGPSTGGRGVGRGAAAARGARCCGGAMPGPDRRHSAAWPAGSRRRSGPDATRPVLAAALLHDVGKTTVGPRHLRPGASPRCRRRSPGRRRVAAGGTGRIGRYLRHAELGADLLAAGRQRPADGGLGPRAPPPAATWTVPQPAGRRPQGRRRRLTGWRPRGRSADVPPWPAPATGCGRSAWALAAPLGEDAVASRPGRLRARRSAPGSGGALDHGLGGVGLERAVLLVASTASSAGSSPVTAPRIDRRFDTPGLAAGS